MMDIRLFSFRGVSIKCSPVVMLLAALAAIFDMWVTLLVAFISLTLHEISHTLVAKAAGMRIDAIEIQPFGFVARISGRISSMDEFAVAATGPVFSLLTACAAAYASRSIITDAYVLEEFIRFNVILGIFNLLPALPLDGGRMLRAVLERFIPRAGRILIWFGMLLGAVLSIFGVYVIAFMRVFNVTPLIMGVFLFAAAIRELKNSNAHRLGTLIKRTDMINRGRSLPMRSIAMHRSVTAQDALRNISLNSYNIITVVDENMHKLGEIDESCLMSGMAANGNNVTIGELLAK